MNEINPAQKQLPRSGVLVTTGIVVAVLGVMAMLSPATAGSWVIRLTGIILMAVGAAQFVQAYRTVSRFDTMMSSIVGTVSGGCGILLLLNPESGSKMLSFILIGFFIMQGVWKIYYAWQARQASGWRWLMISGVISLGLAWMMWKQWPLSGAMAIGILVGVELLLSGVAVILLGLSVKNMQR